MPFNHYAKLKRIIAAQQPGWYIRRIDEPTQARNFKGETINYDHYYRLYNHRDTPIPYGKFQKLDKLTAILGTDVADLPIVNQ